MSAPDSKITTTTGGAAATPTETASTVGQSFINELFSGFGKTLELQAQKRDDIQKEARELSKVYRNVQFVMHRVQALANDQKGMAAVAAACDPHFKSLKPVWAAIAKLIADERHEKYHDLWRFVLQQLIFFAAYAQWLTSHTLLSLPDAVTLLAGDGPANFGIDIEDYLHGVVALPRELSRLCMNAVRTGNFTLPPIIHTFVSDLYSGFRLLNLRNDMLRRRFDGIKYDVQKIEEVLFEVQVRKLAPATAVAKAERLYTAQTAQLEKRIATSNASTSTPRDDESNDK